MGLTEWEARYRAELVGESGHDAALSPLLMASTEGLPPARALDLACGKGHFALWLAEHSWQVTAVDGAPAAITILTASAERRGVQVDARVADLEKGEFTIQPASWELIASCYYLQRSLLDPIKEGLVRGGIAIVIALMAKSQYRAQPGELCGQFAGWEILHDREGADRSGHAVAEIVARKP